LACHACGEVVRCERCNAAVVQPADVLVCERCGTKRPAICNACGSTALRNLRVGVGRVQEEMDALVGAGRVLVGTEALLHQPADNVGVIAFVDFDQELLAPRYRASEQAMALLARAARILGPRDKGGRLVVQTRSPHHPVLDAVLNADPSRMVAGELQQRQELAFPPATALAAVSGAAAGEFIEALGSPLGVEVLGPVEDRWLLRAADHRTLCDALDATPRPSGRVRIEVDPLRI
jgi:primosomal protein N' (replication factor Y)